MAAEDNMTIFLRELGRGNLEIIDEVCSPKFTFHSPPISRLVARAGRCAEARGGGMPDVYRRSDACDYAERLIPCIEIRKWSHSR